MKSLISIIIPVYNRSKLVSETLDSILEQTSSNWECIVVDDGSTDYTWQMLEMYSKKDPRIRIYQRHREPKGAPTCRNIGMNQSVNSNIMFLDSDDLLAPWAIENRLEKALNSDVDMMIFNGLEFDNQNLNNRIVRSEFGINKTYDFFVSYGVAWGTANVLWKKEFIQSIGGWYEYALSEQDTILHLLALHNGAKQEWANELPDFFIRVETGFDKISNVNTIERIINKLDNLKYIESLIEAEDFGKYKLNFFIFQLNNIEYLENSSIKEIISELSKKLTLFSEIKVIILYLRLYVYSRDIKFLHSLVYRSRSILTRLPRVKDIRERPLLSANLFNKLKIKANYYQSIKDKIRVLR